MMRYVLPALSLLLIAPLPAMADGAPAEAAGRPQAGRVAVAALAGKSSAPMPLPVPRHEARTGSPCRDMRCPTFIVLGTAY